METKGNFICILYLCPFKKERKKEKDKSCVKDTMTLFLMYLNYCIGPCK